MLFRFRSLILGSPLPTDRLSHTKVGIAKGLAAFSPDALSSIAYANQEIYLGLLIAGSAGLSFTFPIGITITGILVIVALSYYQTIQAYPSGGGSYVVARENLGPSAGLLAGAALLLDYVLVAAVSLSAGVEALASAFPVLWSHRVLIAIIILVLVTILNLRGMQETGTVMSIPVYFFVASYILLLVAGLYQMIQGGPISFAQTAPPATQPLTIFLLIRTFASGSTALTGIEAIGDSVPAFQKPETKKAGKALILMVVIMATLFLGSLGLSHYFAVISNPEETILSALSRQIFGTTFIYYMIQISTLLVLAVAANTAFSGFPRVAALIAKDRFLPFQLVALGERLVFSNGILLLSAMTGVMVIVFNGESHALVPMFAIGAFLAFTLSQSGMVVHWYRNKGNHWQLKAILNSLGALTTGIMVIVVAVSKFIHGAWITLLVIPLLLLVFYTIHGHYQLVAKQLSLKGLPPDLKTSSQIRLVIPISGVHRGIFDAVTFARSISKKITAVYIEIEPGTGEGIKKRWEEWFPDIPILIEPSPFRTIIGPLFDVLDKHDQESRDGKLAGIVLPDFITTNFFEGILHNQVAWLIKFALLYRRRRMGYQRIIIDVPYHLKK